MLAILHLMVKKSLLYNRYVRRNQYILHSPAPKLFCPWEPVWLSLLANLYNYRLHKEGQPLGNESPPRNPQDEARLHCFLYIRKKLSAI